MNKLDLNRAFAKTPDCIHSAIEMGIRKGQLKMKMRNKIISMVSAAAGLAVALAVAALASGMFDPTPNPDMLAQPSATDIPLPTACPLPAEEPIVWYTETDNYYHAEENCSGMEGAIQCPLTYALELGKGACPTCNPPTLVAAEEPMFWCTKKGNYYHTQEHCCGMQGAIYGTLSYALALDKGPCPVCVEQDMTDEELNASLQETPEQETVSDGQILFMASYPEYENAEERESSASIPENYDLFTTAFGQDIEDLYPGYSYDHSNEISWHISNGEESIYLCDVYPQGTAFFGEELPGVPELHLSNEGLSTDPERVHTFMKNAPAPIGSMYAAASAEVEMQIKLASAALDKEEINLTEVAVYFNSNRQVSACEMQFGYLDPVKFTWKVGADGQIELTESKIAQRQLWNHSAGKDSIDTSTAEDTEFWPNPYSNPNPTTPDNIIVYGPKKGDTYHQNADCSPTFFSFNTIEMTLADAWIAGRLPCVDCLGTGAAKDEQASCFVSDDDDRFHSNQSCSGIVSASGLKAATVAQARSMHKRRCPDCCHTTPINYDLFKLAFDQEISTLYPGWTYEYSLVQGKFDCIRWFYSNDEQIIQVCEVNTNNTNHYIHLNNLQSVDMDTFMSKAPEELRHIYFNLVPQEIAKYPVESGGEERFLYSINVSLENDRISGLEMTYGFFDSISFVWEIDESGRATLLSTNTAKF